MNKTVDLLKQQAIFKRLSDTDLKTVAGYCQQKSFLPCDIILTCQAEANHVYLITKGIVFVYNFLENGEIIPITFIAQGDLFGEMAILTNQTRCAFVEAISPVDCLLIKKDDFRKVVNQIDGLSNEILIDMAFRLKQENKQIEAIKSKRAYDRVLTTLKYLADYFPDRQVGLCHEKLASIVGITRPRLSEIIKKLHKQGIIRYSYKKIRIL